MNTEQLPHIELGFREGASDKVYRAAIEETDGGFVVNFAYGRRGSTLNTGTKTQQPVALDEATGIYDKLVRSKTAKGYKPANGSSTMAGIGMSVAEREDRDTGLRPQLLNPINEDETETYLDDNAWCAQQKFDGRRTMIRKAGSTILATNRDGLSVGIARQISDRLVIVPGDFVIDGESVGETLYVFDLLEDATGDLRQEPYSQRLNVLERLLGKLTGSVCVAETAHGKAKRPFLDWLKTAGKEGVVFKDLRSVWTAGRPASGGSAIKCKFWASCSCVVAGVNKKRSVALALGDQSIGNVTVPPNHPIPAVGQVVDVRYLYVAGVGGSLYQPVYLGVRDDVRIEDCTVERQHIKYKAVED